MPEDMRLVYGGDPENEPDPLYLAEQEVTRLRSEVEEVLCQGRAEIASLSAQIERLEDEVERLKGARERDAVRLRHNVLDALRDVHTRPSEAPLFGDTKEAVEVVFDAHRDALTPQQGGDDDS